MFTFLNFFKKKWLLKKIEKTDLLIFSQDKFNFDRKINYAYFDRRKIYIRYIIKIIIFYIKQKIKGKSFSLADSNTFIKMKKFDCNIALGHDRDESIFKFKDYFPEKKSIAYQFGYWFPNLAEKGFKIIKNRKADFYFLFDERTKKLTEKYLKSNYIVSGSVSSNEIVLKKSDKNYDFMFISNFRTPNSNKPDSLNNSQAFFLNLLSDYCASNNKKYCIARVSSRNDKLEYKTHLEKEENKFLKSNAVNYNLEDTNSFEVAEKSNVCICTHSNLGYQLLARGHKVLFLNKEYDESSWHFMDVISGPFWYKGNNKVEIIKKIEFMSKVDNHLWKTVLNDSKVKMAFDPKNEILKKLIHQLM